jgi:hypothetical protein
LFFYYKGGPSDKGIDLRGKYKGNDLVIQCKNWNKKHRIGRAIVMELEGVLTREPKGTSGIVVGHQFALSATETVRTSKFNIILTNPSDLYKNIDSFVKERKSPFLIFFTRTFLIFFIPIFFCIFIFLILKFFFIFTISVTFTLKNQ